MITKGFRITQSFSITGSNEPGISPTSASPQEAVEPTVPSSSEPGVLARRTLGVVHVRVTAYGFDFSPCFSTGLHGLSPFRRMRSLDRTANFKPDLGAISPALEVVVIRSRVALSVFTSIRVNIFLSTERSPRIVRNAHGASSLFIDHG
jgi:hypothetical protein